MIPHPRLAAPALALLLTAHAIGQTTTRENLTSAGVQDPSWGSGLPVPSGDGRFVAFESAGPNLVAGDTNGATDIFVRDRVTGQTTRVSVSSAGGQGNGNSLDPDITPDGRFVVFTSAATNLVANDTNGVVDVFCHDRLTATTTRVSVGSGGGQITASALKPAISADGRYVVFESGDNNITPGDWCLNSDIFCHDRQTNTTALVSKSLIAFQNFNGRRNPDISDDGQFVVFDSAADELVVTDTNGWNDVFVWSRATDTISLVSVDAAGNQGNNQSLEPSISADGRFVAFTTYASNFLVGDTSTPDIFVRDRLLGQLAWCTASSTGGFSDQGGMQPSISADGRFVAFWGSATNLVAGDTNNAFDVFVRDLALATTVRASVGTTGTQGNQGSQFGRISGNGRCVAFQSSASTLVVPDANGFAADVYVRDRGTTAYVAAYGAGCPGSANLVPSLTNVGWPVVGNLAFGLAVQNGLSSSLAIVFWSLTSANVPLSGCDVLVGDPINLQPIVLLDPSGLGLAPFPLPNDPTLNDLDVFFQSLVIDPAGTFLGLGPLSNGLAVHLGG